MKKGKTLATGSEGKTIKLWDVKKAKEVAKFKGHCYGRAWRVHTDRHSIFEPQDKAVPCRRE